MKKMFINILFELNIWTGLLMLFGMVIVFFDNTFDEDHDDWRDT